MKPAFFRHPTIPYLESRYSEASSACYGLHSHPTVSIGLIATGQATLEVENTHTKIARGDIVMFNPEQTHACNPEPDQAWSYHMLYFDKHWWKQVVKELTSEKQNYKFQSAVITNPKLSSELEDINSILFEPDFELNIANFELQLISWLNQFLSELEPTNILSECKTLSKCKTIRNVKERPEWISEVKNYLEENINQVVKLDQLSKMTNQPITQLIRKFKHHCGLTPYAYLQNHKINRAKELLADGEAIADIAFDLGFADQSHLHRLFKRLVACTPKSYQQV